MFLKKDCLLDEDGQKYLNSHNYSAASQSSFNCVGELVLIPRFQVFAARLEAEARLGVPRMCLLTVSVLRTE